MATVIANSASNGDIQTAIDSASDGDTVFVPGDTKTWTGNVTIANTKGIRLQGAGKASTLITTGGYGISIDTSSSNEPVRVAGFYFKHTNTTVIIRITGTAQDWRIDNCEFDSDNISGCYTIYIGNGASSDSYTYGLIDNNDFTNLNFDTCIFIEWPYNAQDTTYPGDYVWSLAAQRGTAQAVYIEDNDFSGTPASAPQIVDCRWGAKYVLRYNTIHDPWISTHSGVTNDGRDPIWVEVYKNTFTDDANYYTGQMMEMRSVSGIVWGNTSAATLNNFTIGLDHERSDRTDGTGFNQKCDGSRAWDENTGGENGWRCLGQPGWGQPQATDMSAYTFQGMYCWGNKDNQATVNMALFDYGSGSPPYYMADHVEAGREFFNEANMTIGPIAGRPSTCSVGPPRDVYVSNDENYQGVIIYVATAANTWTKYWEPYNYPHPLRGTTPQAIKIGFD